MQPQSLQNYTIEELTNLKEQAVAQIALNAANLKVQADRQAKQDEIIQANIVAIDAQIEILNTPEVK